MGNTNFTVAHHITDVKLSQVVLYPLIGSQLKTVDYWEIL